MTPYAYMLNFMIGMHAMDGFPAYSKLVNDLKRTIPEVK